jgi:hypothetical protein
MRVTLLIDVNENLSFSDVGIGYCPLLQDGNDLAEYSGTTIISEEDLSQDERRQLNAILNSARSLAPPQEKVQLGGGKTDTAHYRLTSVRVVGHASRRTQPIVGADYERRFSRKHDTFSDLFQPKRPDWSKNLYNELSHVDKEIVYALLGRATAIAFSAYQDKINAPKIQLKEVTTRIEVMISYKKSESWFAEWLFHYIGRNWATHFIPTLDEYDIMPSDMLPRGLGRLVSEAGCAIMIYSKDYAQAKGWAGREMDSLMARLARDEIRLGILLIGTDEDDLNELLKPIRREDLGALDQASFFNRETEIKKVVDKLMRGFMGLSDNPYR